MANTSQARKRVRQANARRLHNRSIRSTLRTHIKKVWHALNAKDQTAAMEAYTKLVPLIDRTANKGIIHQNKAARHKSRLLKHIRDLG